VTSEIRHQKYKDKKKERKERKTTAVKYKTMYIYNVQHGWAR